MSSNAKLIKDHLLCERSWDHSHNTDESRVSKPVAAQRRHDKYSFVHVKELLCQV
jgi:hypothetical protein